MSSHHPPPEVTGHTFISSEFSPLLSPLLLPSSPPLSLPLLHLLSPTPLFLSPPPLLTSIDHIEISPPRHLHVVDEAPVASKSCFPKVLIESSQPLEWCTFASITHDVAEIISCKSTLGKNLIWLHGTMKGRDVGCDKS